MVTQYFSTELVIERARQRAEKAKESLNSRYSLPTTVGPPGAPGPGGLRQRRLASNPGTSGHAIAAASGENTVTAGGEAGHTSAAAPNAAGGSPGAETEVPAATAPAPTGAPQAGESQWESRMRAMKERQEARRKQQEQLNRLKGATSAAALTPENAGSLPSNAVISNDLFDSTPAGGTCKPRTLEVRMNHGTLSLSFLYCLHSAHRRWQGWKQTGQQRRRRGIA